jgi:hypothetical protein
MAEFAVLQFDALGRPKERVSFAAALSFLMRVILIRLRVP